MNVYIRKRENDEIVLTLDVYSIRYGRKVASGASINLNHEDFYVDESELDEAEEAQEASN